MTRRQARHIGPKQTIELAVRLRDLLAADRYLTLAALVKRTGAPKSLAITVRRRFLATKETS